tara:strand:- start:3734 stop:3913 length:180 start_codon:yes stop_codon:yes gene_type:complete
MNDPKFVKSELKVTASEELEQEVQEELENSEQSEEKSIASVLEGQRKYCGGNKCSGREE